MAALANNLHYLSVDGTDLSSYLVESTLTPSVASNDTTRGNATYMQRAVGLKDYTLSVKISYDDTTFATLQARLAPGSHAVIYGPQGSTSGKPKLTATMIIESAPIPVTVDKKHVVYDVSFVLADAPSADPFNAGVF